jgi:hypothetical protein
VPLAWYALGVAGAALTPRRDSRLTVFAVLRGAALLIVVTWVMTRWLDQSGRVALLATGGFVLAALGWRAARGEWRTVIVPAVRDLPMLGVATVLLCAWIAPVTRHGIGAVGTGNHADLPSYLLQAGYLLDHGFAVTQQLPGISPETRMFDAFGATALLAPSTALSAAPSIGVMSTLILGAVLLGQLVERLSSRALGGARVAPLLIGATFLISFAFTFNAFAYFLAQVWGLAFGVGLVALVLGGERGPVAVLDGLLISVAGVLTYNPTGVMYAAAALALAAWLLVLRALRRRLVVRAPELAPGAGILLGGLVFLSVWDTAIERLRALGDAVAGWPMPTAPLWSAVGIPIDRLGNSTPTLLAGSVAVAVVGLAGWLATARGRWALVCCWPLAIPAAVWIYRAWTHPGSYQQWKAFSYAQPLLIVAVACGAILLVQRLAAPLGAVRTPIRREALAGCFAAGLLVCSAVYAFWPASFYGEGGCCIAPSGQISEMRDVATTAAGRVRVSTGSVWINDLATAIISRERPVTVDPPSIWPSAVVEPFAGTVSFDIGADPALVEGRLVYAPTS